MNAVEWPHGLAIVITSPNGDVREMSRAAEELLGKSAVDFANRLQSQPLEDGIVMDLDDRKIRMNVLKTQDANYLMLVDLDAQTQLEQQFDQQQEMQSDLKREQERLTVKINLTATVAHEFGNPISAIRMKSHILKNHFNQLPEAKAVQYLDQIDFQLNYLVDLLHDLVLINQLNGPQNAIDTAPFHLEAFCQKIITELMMSWENRKVNLTTHGEVDRVRLDRRLIRYVLLNLVGNALKYSPTGGEVQLDIQAVNNQIIISVSDHGIGIPEQELPNIFTEYYRASNVGDFNGIGLGLAITKACIEMYGGTISVTSKLGEGTTFVASLPLNN